MNEHLRFIKRLQKLECGVTAISIANAKKLVARFGVPYSITAHEDENGTKSVTAEFAVDDALGWITQQFKFAGFTYGYGGEGPRGFDWFLRWCGINAATNPAASPVGKYSLWGKPSEESPTKYVILYPREAAVRMY